LNCATNTGDNLQNLKSDENFLYLKPGVDIIYTYDIIYLESDVKWSTRWDHYLYSSNSKIHWVSLFNSNIILFVLSTIIGYIFCRALRKDIDYINSVR
jgi:transmembrane 9 superfamily protein 2/4